MPRKQNKRILPGVGTIEVSPNQHGYIAIKQQNPEAKGEAQQIVIAPYQVPQIIEWLQECAKELMA